MFNHFIAQMELEDVPLASRKYTWYKPNGRVKSRIDRVLILLWWLERCGWELLSHRPSLDGVRFQQLNAQQLELLSMPFEEDEIKREVWACGSDRCPGLDGINFKFIKEFWDIMKRGLVLFVQSLWSRAWSRGRWQWRFQWRRAWFTWELNNVQQFMNIVEAGVLREGVQDSRLWTLDSSGCFSVRSGYQALMDRGSSSHLPNVAAVAWDIKVPPKVKCFIWRLFMGALPTKENLLRRNVIVSRDQAIFPFCNVDIESA
uniref:Reverse transcriptase zinc-binding domain-containing protein n=1 Tax=Cajanus cajan TaxID=3821 RepID=A0A151TSS9_CAJCA|nr:hypothetical protein KK1_009323 [Cajanus cajan]